MCMEPRNTPGLTDVCFMKTIYEGKTPQIVEKPGVVSGHLQGAVCRYRYRNAETGDSKQLKMVNCQNMETT